MAHAPLHEPQLAHPVSGGPASLVEAAWVRAVRRAIEFLTVLTIASYAVLIVVQVFYRYALNSSITWSEEVVQYALLWGVMIGSAVATDRGAHIVLNPLDARLGPRGRRIRAVLADLCTVAFCGVLIYYGWLLMYRTWYMQSPAADIPMYYVYAAMPIGAALVIFFTIVHSIAGTIRDPGRVDELS
jgi:TRAP-type C4-dicarboxylate transport system permease small subunit